MKQKPNKIKFVKNALAIITIVLLAYFGIMPFILGGKNMASFCKRITPGMKSSDVKRLAERYNYKVIEHSNSWKHTMTIVDTKAMGRFICEISLNQESVAEARYYCND